MRRIGKTSRDASTVVLWPGPENLSLDLPFSEEALVELESGPTRSAQAEGHVHVRGLLRFGANRGVFKKASKPTVFRQFIAETNSASQDTRGKFRH